MCLECIPEVLFWSNDLERKSHFSIHISWNHESFHIQALNHSLSNNKTMTIDLYVVLADNSGGCGSHNSIFCASYSCVKCVNYFQVFQIYFSIKIIIRHSSCLMYHTERWHPLLFTHCCYYFRQHSKLWYPQSSAACTSHTSCDNTAPNALCVINSTQ
jgi:hypothetical protein